jgi:uncharacterized protein (TIGR02246 family)
MALSQQDKAAITELLNLYCHNADYNPPERMRDLFAPEGVFEVPAMNLHFAGVDAIIAFFTASREADASARHVISNIVIEGDGDRATSCAYLQVISLAGGQASTVAFGRYLDTLRRDADGQWRLVHRHIALG